MDQMQQAAHFSGTTSEGKRTSHYVDDLISKGKLREEVIPTALSGLTRPIEVLRASRSSGLISHEWHGSKETFCPPIWWDLGIGSGPCNLGCKNCFLLLTHRNMRDPWRHTLYDNLDAFERAVGKWLLSAERRPQHTLGIGIDRSDSLLYEGIAPHVRTLAPIWGNQKVNRLGHKMILLTKSRNTWYLEEVRPEHRSNIVVSFSLNPQSIADLWEGEWPDTGERIPPTIEQRLDAARFAQDLGFEVRIRLDPIFTPPGWEEAYRDFLYLVQRKGIHFSSWTLGTYRSKHNSLDTWREMWGMLPMRWEPEPGEMVWDGTHMHLSKERRTAIYGIVRDLIRESEAFPNAKVSLCKESNDIRLALQMCNADCNCLKITVQPRHKG